MKRKLEVLAPAGSLKTFYEVIKAGADAVYLGGEKFGARAYADNFTTETLLEALDFAHLKNRRVYLTINTLFKEPEIEQLYDYLLPFYQAGLDAVIVQDFGVLRYLRDAFPGLALHASTQMTVTGAYGVKLMMEAGAKRIVCARELSLSELAELSAQTGAELEVFVHGALCYSYSGQCLMSSMLGGRSGNRGRCAQPCRLPYTVCDADRQPLAKEQFLLSPRDLCALPLLPKLREAGVSSLKIEGRMKQTQYAAGVTAIYCKYADLLESGSPYAVEPADLKRLHDLGNRSGFTDGYFEKQNGRDMITFEKPSHRKTETAASAAARPQQEPVAGTLFLKKEKPAELTVLAQGRSVTVTGMTVMPAQNRPLALSEVKERMQKTGDTPFTFQSLQITMEPDVFVPNGVLNQLRRDALGKLNEELMLPYRRKPENAAKPVWEKASGKTPAKANAPAEWIAATQSRQLLPLLCEASFLTSVYLDSCAYQRNELLPQLLEDAAQLHASGKQAYWILPAVFRRETADFYRQLLAGGTEPPIDGWVARNYEELGFLQELGSPKPIVLDHNLYTCNPCAKQAFDAFSVQRTTLPLELNRKELFGRAGGTDEWIIYGYIPLMTSAQCVCRNTRGCTQTPELLYLKDRMGKHFAVRNVCADCYNVIYNSLPLMLFPMLDDAKRMGIGAYRLSFTIETPAETREILALADSFINHGRKSLPDGWENCYTNGHYKRGVE